MSTCKAPSCHILLVIQKSAYPFDLVHSNICGPASKSSIFDAKWFVTFIDNCTRVTWIFLMKEKSEVFNLFVKTFHMIKKHSLGSQLNICVLIMGGNMSKFLSKIGVVHEFTCVDTLQQNDITERKNRHLV